MNASKRFRALGVFISCCSCTAGLPEGMLKVTLLAVLSDVAGGGIVALGIIPPVGCLTDGDTLRRNRRFRRVIRPEPSIRTL